MCISDWSSYVCSSDLDLLGGDFAAQDHREDVVVVIGKGRIDRHVQPLLLRDAFSGIPDVPSRRSTQAITRSDDLRVGKGCVSTVSSRLAVYQYKIPQ